MADRTTLIILCLVCSVVFGKPYDYGDYYRQYYQNYYNAYNNQRDSVSKPKELKESDVTAVDLRMPGVAPQKQDTYLCTAMEISTDKDLYIVKYKPHAEQYTAHHMLLFGCDMPASKKKYWNCGNMGVGVCGGYKERILYAWGKNAPELHMPKDVGFKIGKDSDVKYLILQVHYLHVDKFKDGKTVDNSGVTLMYTPERQRYEAGIRVMINGWSRIPPHEPAWHLDTACKYTQQPILHPFAFRVHAHKLGVVITGYRIRNGQWTLLGRGDPQRPQAFYPTTRKDLDIENGDTLAARCTFNSMERDTVTYIGATHNDEMCNFYLMYYFDPSTGTPDGECDVIDEGKLTPYFPEDSDTPLETGPPRNGPLKRDYIEGTEELARTGLNLKQQVGWPKGGESDGSLHIKLGQVSGVDMDSKGNVVIFHRASRDWEPGTFDGNNRFKNPQVGAIPEYTVIWLDSTTGKILEYWGANTFYLPHGLTVDHEDNLWLTDVAMHQVFKYSPNSPDKPSLVLGELLVPGSDDTHFCKPTSIAVDSKTGDFFVADGYCNSRIMKFSANGKLLMKIDKDLLQKTPDFPSPPEFVVPHSLSLDETNAVLYLADRENGRILAFNPSNGRFLSKYDHKEMGRRIFAVHYNPSNGGVLHVVNGADYDTEINGFTFSLKTKEILQRWEPNEGFTEPHDVTCNKDGSAVYVAEIIPYKIWKFSSN